MMLRRSHWLRVGLMALVVLVLQWTIAPHAADAGKPGPSSLPKFTMTGIPGDEAVTMNNLGEVVGGSQDAYVCLPSSEYPPRWTLYPLGDAIAELLPYGDGWPDDRTLGSYYLSETEQAAFSIEAYGINDVRQICGIARYRAWEWNGTTWVPTYYREAAFRYDASGTGIFGGGELLLFDGSWTDRSNYTLVSPGGINNLGQVACCVTRVNGAVSNVPAVWDPDDAVNLVTSLTGGPLALGNYTGGINEFGQVTYFTAQGASSGDRLVVRYTPAGVNGLAKDEYKSIPPIGTYGGRYFTGGGALNNFGEVVGQTTVPKAGWLAFTYTNAGVMTNLGTLGNSNQILDKSSAYSVNDAGQVVGRYNTVVNAVLVYKSFLHTPDTGMLDLWKLIPAPLAGVTDGSFQVRKINNPSSGRKYGWILLSNNCVLTPDQ